MQSKNTLALVSGANRGIGLAIATGLARRGVHVLIGSREAARGEAVCASLQNEGLQVQPVQLDTTDDESVSALATLIGRDYGRLDILVNNAGIGLDLDPNSTLSVVERMQRTLEVNVIGTLRLTEAMAPMLAASKRPRIVNVSSELSSFGQRSRSDWTYAQIKMPTYQASKAAVNSLTVSYAELLKDKGIKVNAICPGLTATESTNFNGRPPSEGAEIAINFALLDDEGPTGAFVNDDGKLPW